ncbi:MAG: hypothetical protein LBF41_03270, partial [Deltaproteobacteria bacterium]|nr:hypothetical protein [Deltaproteobacteria bacterium]
MNANFTPKVFPRTAGKTKSYVETNFFLDHPRLENLKKFREGIRLATGDGLLPDGSPAPPLLGEYLKNGPTEEFKAKLSALRKKDRAPDAADEAALATFLLAAGSAESGDFDGALEFFRDFPRDGTRTARALKAVAGEALVARFLENDLFDEARDVLDLMDAESWGMKRLDNLPIELFKVVEAGPAPNPDRNDPDDPDDLDEPRKAFSAMTGEVPG